MENLSHIKIEGFKSIKKLDLEMKPINVLIGANGSGKSNFIEAIEISHLGVIGELDAYISSYGAEYFLHFGSKITEEILITISSKLGEIDVSLIKKDNDIFNISYNVRFTQSGPYSEIVKIFKGIKYYHFHDTSNTAYFKNHQPLVDYDFLRKDGKNIAPFLYRLKNEFNQDYKNIIQAVQTVAPFFNDFVLNPVGNKNDERVLLRWQHKNDINNVFSASQLSDGTARFICMATLFLQPKDLRPTTIVLDEPEIGLHPAALSMLAEIIKAVVNDGSQVIISTQSVELANYFETDDFIVVDYENGESKFKRLDKEKLGNWIDNYQIGEAWSEGLLGGEPT